MFGGFEKMNCHGEGKILPLFRRQRAKGDNSNEVDAAGKILYNVILVWQHQQQAFVSTLFGFAG